MNEKAEKYEVTWESTVHVKGNLTPSDLREIVDSSIRWYAYNTHLDLSETRGLFSDFDGEDWESMFADCSKLREITFPANMDIFAPVFIFYAGPCYHHITYDGDNETYASPALRKVHIAPGNKVYRSIDGVVYAGKSLVYFPPYNKTRAIPDGIESIRDGAFYYYAHEDWPSVEIEIPESIRRIGFYAFNGTCVYKIHYKGTIEQLKKICGIDDYLSSEVIPIVFHCSDGDAASKVYIDSDYAELF